MRHQLKLYIPDLLEQTVFQVEDISSYATGLPVDCLTLEVTTPGKIHPMVFTPNILFRQVLTSCDLGLEGCDSEYDPVLPDGIYNVRYSVSPNEKVFVEYNFLRITNLQNQRRSVLCSLDTCMPGTEKKIKFKLLQDARIYTEAAKANVEDCNEPHKGLELYGQAKKILDQLSEGCTECF